MKPTASAIPAAHSRTTDFFALAKPRLNLLVVVSALAGYVMASGDTRDVWRLLCMVAGTALVAGGASAFNQLLERQVDALMHRTRSRPLPDGRLHPKEAREGLPHSSRSSVSPCQGSALDPPQGASPLRNPRRS